MMGIDRKTFLRISSLGAVGVVGGRLLAAVHQPSGEDEKAAEGVAGGKRWAMVIDVRKCLESDIMDRCVRACNIAHNIPDFRNEDGTPDRKNEVKWIWPEPYHNVFPSQSHENLGEELRHASVLTLCNHCENPPCVRVCPTQATFRRPDGIVAMDQHRCIGCRFCIAACPYGSRSFNWKDPRPHIPEINPDYPTRAIGVVEKCNFCAERLAEGKMPACVEAAGDSGALVFGDLNDEQSKVRAVLASQFTIRRKPELGTEPAVYYIT